MITDQLLTQYALPVFIGALIILMIGVILSLGKKYNGGFAGNTILLTALAGGLVGFVMIFVVQSTILDVV
jgi:hypothetical protein